MRISGVSSFHDLSLGAGRRDFPESEHQGSVSSNVTGWRKTFRAMDARPSKAYAPFRTQTDQARAGNISLGSRPPEAKKRAIKQSRQALMKVWTIKLTDATNFARKGQRRRP
jgi:hypothetical protein